MAGRFVEDMLRAKYGRMQDGRNPYGSRGGYVVSSRGRRDRAMEDYGDYGEDYARGGRGGSRSGRGGSRSDYGYDYRGGMDYGYDMASGRDRESRDYEEDMRGRDYHYPYGMPYGMPPMDYGYDMRGRDYGDDEEMQYGKMSKKDFEKWGKMLENEDGTRGEHFKKEQAEQIAKQMGIDVHSLGGAEVFAMTMNMEYSDLCNVARKYGVDRPEYYADLAKAFLHDKDYKGNPEEKLWLYYKCIISED